MHTPMLHIKQTPNILYIYSYHIFVGVSSLKKSWLHLNKSGILPFDGKLKYKYVP